MKHTIQITINGETMNMDVEPTEILLDVLREKIGIKSPKIGCERGDCGACTILLDGKSVRSCLILAIEADGRTIETVEGLSREGPNPLQKAMLRNNAFQCGFCAPGMTMTLTELLRKNPDPDQATIQEAIAGNLCRCTGYKPIIQSALECARTEEGA